jgi:hypothetical protein
MSLAGCLASFLLLTAACSFAGPAQQSRVGGYVAASLTHQDVVAAAAFAIKAQQDAMQEKKDKETPKKLALVTVLKAEHQVVAGINYRLRLKVQLNGQEKTAEAVVWWQAWKKPDPFELTSWTWD